MLTGGLFPWLACPFKKQAVITIKLVITQLLKGQLGPVREFGSEFSSQTYCTVCCSSQRPWRPSLMSFTAGFTCSKLPNWLLYTSWALCLNPGLGTLTLLFPHVGSLAFSINKHCLEVSREKESTDDPTTQFKHILSCTHAFMHTLIWIQWNFTCTQSVPTSVGILYTPAVFPGLQLQANSQGLGVRPVHFQQ